MFLSTGILLRTLAIWALSTEPRPRLGRNVALQFLPDDISHDDPEFRERESWWASATLQARRLAWGAVTVSLNVTKSVFWL
jgi:hypothetical protein